MKILVVDDDPTMRRLVARLASRHAGAEVREAEDGVAALAAIEAETPDVVFTDMQMPHLGGVGLLEALRSSVEHKEIPVVAVSSITEKAMVLRMVELGIEDYLLKPLDPANAADRFDAILTKIAARVPHPRSDGTTRAGLLLVDREAGYGDVVRAAVGGRFEVVDHLPAAAALAWAMTDPPAVALLGEGLPMPGETAIAATLRERGTTVILLAASTATSADGFDALVARSYAPKKLAEALQPHLHSSTASDSQLTAALAAGIRGELAAGCRQSLGILVGVESVESDGADALPADAIAVQVVLSRSGDGESVQVLLLASRADVSVWSEPLEGDHKEPQALLSALATLAGARVAQALIQLGWALVPSEPVVLEAGIDPESVTARVDLSTDTGQRLHAVLRVARTETTDSPSADPPSESSS